MLQGPIVPMTGLPSKGVTQAYIEEMARIENDPSVKLGAQNMAFYTRKALEMKAQKGQSKLST